MQGADFYISDLHLSDQKPELTALFETFLRRDAAGARSLTIGGDLLDYYHGPKQLRLDYFARICTLLRELSEGGTRIDFVIGNRDFLLHRDADLLGARGHALFCARDLDAERVVMHHGDTFCIDDRGYRVFRSIMHFLPLYTLSRVLPESTGRRVSRFLRSRSERRRARREEAQRSRKQHDIKDEAVIPFLRRVPCDTLVCGHIHRPQERSYAIDGRRARLLVLGEWKPEGAVIARALPGERLALVEMDQAGMRAWGRERVAGPAGQRRKTP